MIWNISSINFIFRCLLSRLLLLRCTPVLCISTNGWSYKCKFGGSKYGRSQSNGISICFFLWLRYNRVFFWSWFFFILCSQLFLSTSCLYICVFFFFKRKTFEFHFLDLVLHMILFGRSCHFKTHVFHSASLLGRKNLRLKMWNIFWWRVYL